MTENPDKAVEQSRKRAGRRAQMGDDWDGLIEELIEEGRKKGAFDNLPGKGKPLNLSRNPFAADTELAHSLLKDNDLKPAWIMKRGKITEIIKTLRAEIGRDWLRHEQAYHLAQGKGLRGGIRISWDDACKKWEAQIVDLNKQISDFNLARISDSLEMFKLNLEDELARAGARRWLK